MLCLSSSYIPNLFNISSLVAIQSHYDLGKVLHSICDGKDVEDTIFIPIANQINHGKEWIVKDKDLSIAVAELNMKAGKQALDGCDFKTAYSYLSTATSLLPEGHWDSHYDLSLRLNFLMASAANSTSQYEKAELVLRNVLEKARCSEDKLPPYYLLSESKWLERALRFNFSSVFAEWLLSFFSPSITGQAETSLRCLRFCVRSTRG